MSTKTTSNSAKSVAAQARVKVVAKTAANTPAKPTRQTADKSASPAAQASARIAALSPAAKPLAKAASRTADKKDVQKLQRAVVDGLEDVKAQEIVVFDTEHLSSLFERVIIASGTSNRQTKALAASVVDAVRAAGFQKPRVEGEDNGEWIIVDCGAVVAHVMQPHIRSYYNLEELWGDKPVRLKLGAAKPLLAKPTKLSAAPAQPARAAKPESSLRRSSAAKKGVEAAFPSKAQLKKLQEGRTVAAKKAATNPVSKRAIGQKDAETVARPRVKTLVVNAPGKPAGKTAAAKTAMSKSAAAKRVGTKPAVRATRAAPAKKATPPAARKA